MEIFLSSLIDALVDSAKMIPLLFIIYMLIEVVEFKFGNKMGKYVARAGKAGPLIGALTGLIPQCGVSVMGTALYTQRLVTIGTLFAVYLATSDEAIPIILAQPDAIGVLVPLLIAKFVIAVGVGYALDLIFVRRNRATLAHIDSYEHGTDTVQHHHEVAFEEKACCGHTPTSADKTLSIHELFYHPLVHTLKIFLFIFVVSLAIDLVFGYVGQDTIGAVLASHTMLQPFLAALVGLIPNCAASVAITEFYLSGIITFGAAVAGLCASGGLGILVLFKEGNRREALWIVALLFAISVAAGIVTGLFM